MTSAGDLKIGLALSGGGSRAIAFHLGCLRALERLGVLRRVEVISTVSGGSVIGACLRAHTGDFASFETKVRTLLARGLAGPMFRKLFSLLGLKIITAFVLVGAAAAGASFLRLLLKGLRLVAPQAIARRWEGVEIRSPLHRFASRTTLLEAVLDECLFGGARLVDLPAHPHLVINATELRTGSAFRFGTLESGSWRWGKVHADSISVSHAVAASACYPLFLPAFDETLTFNKNGHLSEQRVSLTDGGVYDNLGLGCLWANRSEAISLNVIPVNTIICCSAGYGLRQEPPSQFLLGRMRGIFSTVFERAQNSAIHRLHEAKRTGEIKGFILPYLGQLDADLPDPPANLVRRDEVYAYPTDFNAMPGEWIERLSSRGDQLTMCLAQAYLPELFR